MSKTKLTYITPVLDFVQAESEGILDVATGSTNHTESGDGFEPGNNGEDEAKDSYFQFDDSDADFFNLE